MEEDETKMVEIVARKLKGLQEKHKLKEVTRIQKFNDNLMVFKKVQTFVPGGFKIEKIAARANRMELFQKGGHERQRSKVLLGGSERERELEYKGSKRKSGSEDHLKKESFRLELIERSRSHLKETKTPARRAENELSLMDLKQSIHKFWLQQSVKAVQEALREVYKEKEEIIELDDSRKNQQSDYEHLVPENIGRMLEISKKGEGRRKSEAKNPTSQKEKGQRLLRKKMNMQKDFHEITSEIVKKTRRESTLNFTELERRRITSFAEPSENRFSNEEISAIQNPKNVSNFESEVQMDQKAEEEENKENSKQKMRNSVLLDFKENPFTRRLDSKEKDQGDNQFSRKFSEYMGRNSMLTQRASIFFNGRDKREEKSQSKLEGGLMTILQRSTREENQEETKNTDFGNNLARNGVPKVPRLSIARTGLERSLGVGANSTERDRIPRLTKDSSLKSFLSKDSLRKKTRNSIVTTRFDKEMNQESSRYGLFDPESFENQRQSSLGMDLPEKEETNGTGESPFSNICEEKKFLVLKNKMSNSLSRKQSKELLNRISSLEKQTSGKAEETKITKEMSSLGSLYEKLNKKLAKIKMKEELATMKLCRTSKEPLGPILPKHGKVSGKSRAKLFSNDNGGLTLNKDGSLALY